MAITLNIATGGEADARDFIIDSRSLTIGAGQLTGTIMLTGVNNDMGDGHQTINLTLSASGTLPNGWTLGGAEHAVDILDDDLSVSFVLPSDTIDEPASGSTTKSVQVTVNQPPPSAISLTVSTAGSTATAGAGADFTAGASVAFAAGATGSDLTKNITLTINLDAAAELDETIVLTLSDPTSSLTTGGNAFSLRQSTHTVTILANDNTVSFAPDAVTTLGENGGTARVVLNVNRPAPERITLDIETTGTADPGDFRIDSRTLTIEAGQPIGTIILTSVNNNVGEGNSAERLDARR